jgi:hypothetical protein
VPLAVTPSDLPVRWEELAEENATRAYRAIWALSQHPGQSIAFLAQHLRAAPALDAVQNQQLARWVSELDSDDFTVREDAAAALMKLGEAAEGAYHKALAGQTTPELRRRINELRQQFRGATQARERVRAIRSVEVLEKAGTPEAVELLKTLAGGAREALLTKEAKATLDRLQAK